MKINIKTKQRILALLALVIFSMPIAVSAQGFWDSFFSEVWYSILLEGVDPNDKDKKPGQPQPTPAPTPEACDPTGVDPFKPRCEPIID